MTFKFALKVNIRRFDLCDMLLILMCCHPCLSPSLEALMVTFGLESYIKRIMDATRIKVGKWEFSPHLRYPITTGQIFRTSFHQIC
jgi:hypothetical protein